MKGPLIDEPQSMLIASEPILRIAVSSKSTHVSYSLTSTWPSFDLQVKSGESAKLLIDRRSAQIAINLIGNPH